MLKTNLLLLVAASVGFQSYAQDAVKTTPETEVTLPQVTVTSTSHPFKPYRAMFPGLKAYERLQASLGPQSQLRFRIFKKDEADPSFPPPASVKVSLLGQETSTVLALDADDGFELPLSQTLYDEDFDIILNHKTQAYGWVPDVRSPNVPQNARRLGDIRLECSVLWEIEKGNMSFAMRVSVNVLTLGGGICTAKVGGLGYIAPRKIASARIIDGEKTEVLKTWGSTYVVPVGDKSWSNEALIEFEFATS